jgi:hypothetical protein
MDRATDHFNEEMTECLIDHFDRRGVLTVRLFSLFTIDTVMRVCCMVGLFGRSMTLTVLLITLMKSDMTCLIVSLTEE